LTETAETASEPRRDRSRPGRREARRRKAVREIRIIQLLNSGIAIAEIAARERLTERRVRQFVQEILDKRAPRAPAEYAALQVSRLNEALVVAYAAMGGGNLAAVDRVMKITRELDRYHGFAAADLVGEPRRLPAPSQNRAYAGCAGSDWRRNALKTLDSRKEVARFSRVLIASSRRRSAFNRR